MRAVHLPIKSMRILLVLLLLPVGMIGISYSGFNGLTQFNHCVSTGNMDVVFSDLNLIEGASSPCSANAEIMKEGKWIEINIEDAVPGYSATFSYEVSNNGTVPVIYELDELGENEMITISSDERFIAPEGGKAQGQIKISLADDALSSEDYALDLMLTFQQAVVERSK